MKSRYRQRRSKITPKAGLYAGAIAVCAAGLGWAAFESYGKAVPNAFNCYEETDQRHSFALVDSSQPRWNQEHGESLRRYFDTLFAGLGFNEKLSVYTTEPDEVGSVISPRFHVCGGANAPDNLEAVGAASASAGYLQKQKQRIYEDVYAPSIETLLELEPDQDRLQVQQSPVLEMIQSLSRLPELQPGSRLIIVSDLLQNSDSTGPFCSVKNRMPPFSIFKHQKGYARVRPDSLEGVEVVVLMLQRPGYGREPLQFCKDEEELIKFWRDYFTDNGVSQPSFIRIRHGFVGGG